MHLGNEASGVLAGRLAMAAGVGIAAAAPSIGPALACYLLSGLGGGFMGVAANRCNVADAERPRLLGVIESRRNTTFGLA